MDIVAVSLSVAAPIADSEPAFGSESARDYQQT
jgi:hypothetical protein